MSGIAVYVHVHGNQGKKVHILYTDGDGKISVASIISLVEQLSVTAFSNRALNDDKVKSGLEKCYGKLGELSGHSITRGAGQNAWSYAWSMEHGENYHVDIEQQAGTVTYT